MTDWNENYQTDQTNGSPGSGERRGSRRPRSGTPNYPAGSVFSRPEIRALVADIVDAKVTDLGENPVFGTAFLTNQLDEVLNELRGVE